MVYIAWLFTKVGTPISYFEQKAYIFIKETAFTISVSIFLYTSPMGVIYCTNNWTWDPTVISQVLYDSMYIHHIS